jgi:hypothetical protein
MPLDRSFVAPDHLPSAFAELVGLALVIGGAIAGVFTLWVLLLLPFALLKGALDRNARGVLRDLLRLFRALLDCIAAYASRR